MQIIKLTKVQRLHLRGLCLDYTDFTKALLTHPFNSQNHSNMILISIYRAVNIFKYFWLI